MPKVNVNESNESKDLMFEHLFWAARHEHVKLNGKISQGVATSNILSFGEANGWKWVKELVEVSRLESAGEYHHSKSTLDQVLTVVPEKWSGLCYFLYGLNLRGLLKLEEAIAAFKKAASSPDFGKTYYCLYYIGVVHTRLNNFDEAIASLRSSISMASDRHVLGLAWDSLGVALYRKGDNLGAIEAFKRAISIPEFIDKGKSWFNLGNILDDQNEYDKAVEAYSNALAAPDVEDPGTICYNLGVLHATHGFLDSAVEAYKRALDSSNFQKTGVTWYNLGTVYSDLGDHNKAIEAYRNALATENFESPDSAWYNIGVTQSQNGEDEKALESYKRAIETPNTGSSGNAWNNIGIILARLKDYKGAVRAFENSIAVPSNEGTGNAWYNLGNSLWQMGCHDEAIAALKNALSSPGYGNPGRAWNNMGVFQSLKGDFKNAILAYEKATTFPDDYIPAKAWANLGEAYATSGETEKALSAFEEALKNPDQVGWDHARARSNITLIKSKLDRDSMFPDDRAIMRSTSNNNDSSEAEDQIIAAIEDAKETQYKKYLDLKDSTRDNNLSILRGWSSSVPLLDGSERRWRGGGYFVKWRGFGLVIDPGFDFLQNFHDAGYHGREINVVVVSHNHPDHNSDLLAIDNLRYELFKHSSAENLSVAAPYALVWDEDTSKSTLFAAANPKHQYPPIAMPSGFPQPIDLSRHDCKVPIRIIPFEVFHGNDVPHALGMVIELTCSEGFTFRIGYTADTEYRDELCSHLKECDLLIAHISQPTIEELRDATKIKSGHLGYRGTSKLLAECKPKLALIGEFWAGYADLRIPLVKGLRERSGLDHILPSGIGMHLQLPSMDIECTECSKPTPFSDIRIAPPTTPYSSLAYLCPKCML